MSEKKKEVCILSVAGMLGSTFDEEGFRFALEKNPDMIGCDSGTSDSGPFYLGKGKPRMNRKAAKRDLELMITEGVKRNIPVLVGSAGTAGGDPHVDWMIEIVKEIAQENNIKSTGQTARYTRRSVSSRRTLPQTFQLPAAFQSRRRAASAR